LTVLRIVLLIVQWGYAAAAPTPNTPIISEPSFRPSVWTGAAALAVVVGFLVYAIVSRHLWLLIAS
jgi:hypothetical protein